MSPLEGLHCSGRHELSFTPGEISLRGVFHHYQATEESWACNGPVLSVPYLINLFSENSVKNSVLNTAVLFYTLFFFLENDLCFYCDLLAGTSESWKKRSKLHLLSLLHTRKIEENNCFLMDLKGRKVPLGSPQLPCQLNQLTRWSPRVSKSVEGDVCVCYEGSWEQSQFYHLWRENSSYFLKCYLFTPPVGANYKLPLISSPGCWAFNRSLLRFCESSSRCWTAAQCWKSYWIPGQLQQQRTSPVSPPQVREPSLTTDTSWGNQPGQKGEVQGMTHR